MRHLIWLAFVIATTAPTAPGQEPQFDRLTGKDFEQRMEEPGLAALSGLSLRGVLDQIEQTYNLACFRDRNIDPDQIVELSDTNGNVRHLLGKIAEASGGSVSLPGNAVYLGPNSKARILRTLILQRTADVRRVLRAQSDSAWLKSRTFEWPMLSSPRQLVTSLAESLNVTVANPEQIEHDLWASGVLPEMTPVEILSVLLVGFDLTYVISEDGQSITLVSLPDEQELAVSKPYTLKQDESISDWLRVAPAIDTNQNGRRVLVKGMVEDHEAIRDLRSGKLKPEAGQLTELTPLDRRRFTLQAAGVPAVELIADLEQNGIRFVYDPQALRQNGIDLEQRVKVDVNKATAEELFAELFGPLGLECELSGITVRLKPKQRQ